MALSKMDGFEKQERLREARRRLVAQRNRAGRLRGRVVAASLICFALLWGVVFVQMATGNDPVLAEKAAAQRGRRHRLEATRSRQANTESEIATEPEVEAEPEPEVEAESAVEALPEEEAEPEVEAIPEEELQPEEAEVELEPMTTSQS